MYSLVPAFPPKSPVMCLPSAMVSKAAFSIRSATSNRLMCLDDQLYSQSKQKNLPQHHEGGEEKSGRVGKTLALNVRSGTVDGLEDGSVFTNVTRWSQTETTNETGRQVGQNVTVPVISTSQDSCRVFSLQVWHDHNSLGEWCWVGSNPQANSVKEVLGVLDVRVLFGDFSTGVQEHTVGHFPAVERGLDIAVGKKKGQLT